MSGPTYGKHSNLDVSLSTSAQQALADNVIGVLGHPERTVQVSCHVLTINDDKVKCNICKQEADVPALLQSTAGNRQVLYKMYLAGGFKQLDCEPPEPDTEKYKGSPTPDPISTQPYYRTTTNNSGDTVDMYIPQGQVYKFNGGAYTYQGDDVWQKDDGSQITTDMLLQHQANNITGDTKLNDVASKVRTLKAISDDTKGMIGTKATPDAFKGHSQIGTVTDTQMNNDGSMSATLSIGTDTDEQKALAARIKDQVRDKIRR